MELSAMEKIKLIGVRCPKCKKVDTLTLYYNYDGKRVIMCNVCGDVTTFFQNANDRVE